MATKRSAGATDDAAEFEAKRCRRLGQLVAEHGENPEEPAAASEQAEACAVGDGFFDGVVGFSDDGNVTLVERCGGAGSAN